MVAKKSQMKVAKKSQMKVAKKSTKKNIVKRTPKQIKYASIQARKKHAKKSKKTPKNMVRLLTKSMFVKDGDVKTSGMLLHLDNKKTVMIKDVNGKKTKKVLCGKPSIKRIQQQFLTL